MFTFSFIGNIVPLQYLCNKKKAKPFGFFTTISYYFFFMNKMESDEKNTFLFSVTLSLFKHTFCNFKSIATHMLLESIS